jgi:hypothetical protein
VNAWFNPIILVGFDAQRTEGKNHSHGDHPGGWGNADNCHDWPPVYQDIARACDFLGVTVYNASLVTAITAFKRVDIRVVLE